MIARLLLAVTALATSAAPTFAQTTPPATPPATPRATQPTTRPTTQPAWTEALAPLSDFDRGRPDDRPPAGVTPRVTQEPLPEADDAAVRFVSPDESDALAEALREGVDGETVVLRAGTYRVGGLQVSRPMTLRAAPGETVYLKGSVVVTDWTRDDGDGDQPRWRHDHWTTHLSTEPNPHPAVARHRPIAAERDMLFLNEQGLEQVGTLDELRPGTFVLDPEARRLWIADDPAGHTLEATVHEYGVWVGRTAEERLAGASPVPNVRLLGLNALHYGDEGVRADQAHDLTIEDCAFAWNGQRGLGIAGSRGVQIRRCAFTSNGRVGLRMWFVHDVLVERCHIAWNNVEDFNRSWDAAGVKITYAGMNDNPPIVMRQNLAEHNNAVGLWYDVNVDGGAILDNVVRHNRSIGIYFEISEGVLIADNLCHDNASGIVVLNAWDARIEHNTLRDNRHGVVARRARRFNRERHTLTTARAAHDEPYTTGEVAIVHNLIGPPRTGEYGMLINVDTIGDDPADPARLVSDIRGNVLLKRSDDPRPVIGWSKGPADAKQVRRFHDFATLADEVPAVADDNRVADAAGTAAGSVGLENVGRRTTFDASDLFGDAR